MAKAKMQNEKSAPKQSRRQQRKTTRLRILAAFMAVLMVGAIVISVVQSLRY